MIIVAGLGNPGPKYQGNRHNIGFMAVDGIARRWSFGPERAKFQSIMGVGHPGEPQLVHGYVLSDFHKADQPWLTAMLDAVADALPFALAGDDDRYQAEVMRLAPAPKFSPRQAARGEG